MPSYDIFFFGALFFLLGVLFASLELKFWTLVIVFVFAFSCLAFGYFKKDKRLFYVSCLSFFIIIGSLFYAWDNENFKKETVLIFNNKISFSGVIVSDPKTSNGTEEFSVTLDDPFSGKVLVRALVYPSHYYGDRLQLEGTIKDPKELSEGYANYLKKEGVGGLVSFPIIEVLENNEGNTIKKFLFGIKNKVSRSFDRVLSSTESAFLSGLTLGETEGLSKSFKEAMRESGTTHLVALSGYNISIIITAVMGLLVYFFSRRISFSIATLIVLGFVVMTGAEASVVRAAIMGFLVLFAGEVGRLYDFRNAIILAGLLMVLENPKVLVFDIGFELSFLALVGITYLKPSIEKLLVFYKGERLKKSFLNWRENLITTFSAQVMVLPILILNFDQFSITSLIANVLVLELIPVTMGLGFLVAGFSFISYQLSLFLGWLVLPLLKIEIGIIEIFSRLPLSFSFQFGLILSLVYYAFIIIFIIYVRKFNPLTGK